MTKFSSIAALFIGLFCLVQSQDVTAQRGKKKNSQELAENRLREAEFYFIEAEKYYLLEDYAKSLLYFQRVAELNPENPTVHFKIAQVLSKGNKEDDLIRASASIDYAISLDKKNKYFYLLASQIYSNLTDFDKATQALETMMTEVKGTEEYLYELAALYQYDHKPAKAIETYDRAENALGIDEVSSLQKQRLYFEMGQEEKGLAEGRKLLDAYPEEEGYVVGFAETLSQFKKYDEAISVVEKFIREHPEAGSAKVLLAGLYRDNGREQDSRKLMMDIFDDPGVDLNSKIIVLTTYSELLRQKTDADKNLIQYVESLYAKLVATDGKNPNVRLIGGDLYLGLDQKKKAGAEYYHAIKLGSTTFEAWQNLLIIESELDQLDSLVKHSEDALELFPNQSLLYYFSGYANLRKKNYKISINSLEQAKRLTASNPSLVAEINGMLGDCYYNVKDFQKSDRAYEDALAFNPYYDYVLNNYSYYLALRKENLDKAEKMSALLIKNNPDNPTYLDTHAWVLFAREKYKDAKKAIEKAIQSGDKNPAYFEHYGDILFKLWQVDEAVAQWQKAKSLDPHSELIDKKITNRRLY